MPLKVVQRLFKIPEFLQVKYSIWDKVYHKIPL